jgi:phospholipase C
MMRAPCSTRRQLAAGGLAWRITAMIVVVASVASPARASAAGPAPAAAGSPARLSPDVPPMCGHSGTPPPLHHVILVMLENHGYGQVIGNTSAAPYQNTLAAGCGVATEMFGATHYSAANYLAISAGEYPPNSPGGCWSVTACQDPGMNVYRQLQAAGLTWGAYMEGMPSGCDPVSNPARYYKIGHNPPLFYTDIASGCPRHDVGVPNLGSASGAFYNDLRNQTLPSFSWISPNTENDGDSTCTSGVQCALTRADTWLSNFIPIVTASRDYQAGDTLVLITYDEGAGKDATQGEDCTNATADLNGTQPSCHLPFFVVYPYVRAGATDRTFFDHYSVTRTIEDLFGLRHLAHAADPQTASLVNHFGIRAR